MPVSGNAPWEASDGTRWLHTAGIGWTGWEPGEPGVWIMTPSEFRRVYPEAPTWDAADDRKFFRELNFGWYSAVTC